jgi:gas vesicle protein
MQDLTIIYLQKKVSMLEDQLNLIQGMIKHDSTRWEIKHGTNFEEEIRHIFNQNEPDKPRNLAYVVNDQLHDIRDDITTLDEDLKKMTLAEELKKNAKVEENALEGTESADFEDMVSMESNKMQ